jgi:stress-induced morphogen
VSQSVADLAELKRMIEAALPGAEVEVIDEGGGDHLRASVVASQFEGLSRLDQHRLVKAAVRDRFEDGTIHALSVKTTAKPSASSASRPGADGSEKGSE